MNYTPPVITDDPAPGPPERLPVTSRPTVYEVTCLPDEPYDGNLWSVEVQYTGAHRFGHPRPAEQQWAVRLRGHWCLNRDNHWDLEPIPSEREDDWLTHHRFTLTEALERAKTMAPTIQINGTTPAGALARRRQRDTAQARADTVPAAPTADEHQADS